MILTGTFNGAPLNALRLNAGAGNTMPPPVRLVLNTTLVAVLLPFDGDPFEALVAVLLPSDAGPFEVDAARTQLIH
jgi:hypothetical protein